MSEPYGSGQSYGQGGYGSPAPAPGYEQQQYGGQQGAGQYGTGQQPQQQYSGSYGQQHTSGPGGYPSTGAPTPSAPRSPQDRLGLIATIVTYVGFVCAGVGVLGFIMWLAADIDGIIKFAFALLTLAVGLGFGALNAAVGSYLSSKR